MTDVVVPSTGVKYEDLGEYTATATLPSGWLYVYAVTSSSLHYTVGGTIYTRNLDAGDLIMIYSDGSSWSLASGTVRILRLKL